MTGYKSYHIKVVKKENIIYWQLFWQGKFILEDGITIDGGGPFQNLNHAVNDCKKNIDCFFVLFLFDINFC